MKRSQIFGTSLISLLLGLGIADVARGADFSFSRIAETSTFGSFNLLGSGLGTAGGWSSYRLGSDPDYQRGMGLAINNVGGQVAFWGQLNSGKQGVYVGWGQAPKLIADNQTTSLFGSFGSGLSINDKGKGLADVAFYGNKKSGGTGIFVSNGINNNATSIVDTNGIYSSFARGLSINNSGEVAFFANLDSGGEEIFKSDGTSVTNISRCVGTGASSLQCPLSGGRLTEQSPTINNDGMVAFSSAHGIFTGDELGNYQILANPNAFWNTSYREANINDAGEVSGFAHNNGRGQLLFKSDGVSGAIVVGNNRTTGPAQGDFFYVGTSAINNNGNVAFMARQARGVQKGIYVGHDAIADKVIAIGDYLTDADGVRLYNSPIVDLAMDRESLSDDNEIAFWAKLADGTEGIFRADKFFDSQFNPLLPNCPVVNGALFSFCDLPSGGWYDPPAAYGFTYKMTSNSLFTSILDFPISFENPFTVTVGDTILGTFAAGDHLDFVDLLGHGVSEFTITGIDVDPSDPRAFPIKLAFDTERASFDMFALVRDEQNVPEPTAVLSILIFGGFSIALKKKKAK